MADVKQVEHDLHMIEEAMRKNRAPELYRESNLGFQLLDSSEDEDKAVGVRVFRLPNGLFLYAPVFFVDGDIRGEDLLYIKDKDLVVPFTQEWVHYLMSKNPMSLGKPTKEDEDADTLPDLTIFQASGTSEGGMPTGEVKAAAIMNKLGADADPMPAIDIAKAIKKADRSAKEGLIALMLTDDRFANHVLDRLGGAIEELRPKTATIFDADGDEFSPIVKRGDVEVIVETLEYPKAHDMPEREKEKIHREKMVVRDYRQPKDLSDVLEMGKLKLVEPQETGLYQMATKDGGVVELLNVRDDRSYGLGEPLAVGEYSSKCRILVDTENKIYSDRPHKSLVALHTADSDSQTYWDEWFDNIPSDKIEPLPYKEAYFLIGPVRGSVLGPITPREVIKAPNGQVTLKEYRDSYVLTQTEGQLTSHASEKDGKEYIVPGTWKALRVTRSEIPLLSMSEAQDVLFRNGKELSISKEANTRNYIDRGEFDAVRKGANLDPISALKFLILDCGVSERRGREMLEAARGRKSAKFLIKQAAPAPLLALPLAPPGGPPTGQALPMGAGPADPGAMMAMQSLQQAIDAGGQPEALDVPALSALIEATDSRRLFDEWIGDMLTCLDREGRAILRIYQEWDELKEEFGQKDLLELEDALLNNFKGLGDLVLKLKELGTSRVAGSPVLLS